MASQMDSVDPKGLNRHVQAFLPDLGVRWLGVQSLGLFRFTHRGRAAGRQARRAG